MSTDAESPAVQIEIRAARLYAGWETANDTDDILDDPILMNCIEHMLGYADLHPESVEVYQLYCCMIDPSA